ncbi:MAG: ABC transporter permease [Lentisphaerae bacterium]|jgi:lipopolysaccharide transport system permease protein|nr:ABC transporter permease [Lentisphaerota bacterium]
MDDNSSFETVITARSGWFDINLRELWRYRDLALLFVRRNFIANYKQTILGPAWAIVQPLLTTVVFTIVFGRLAKLPTDGVPPFLFYMCGNIAWGYFAGCLTATGSTFTQNAAIFGKVYFPRLTMPISTVISQLISFAIQFLFFLGFLAFYSFLNKTVYLTPLIWLLPFFLLQMAMLGLGCGIIVSSLTTKYRDLAMLVSFGTQLWMYATPVVYPAAMVPEKWQTLYRLNPMVAIIEGFRDMFFSTGTFNWTDCGISWAVTLLMLGIGVVLFSKVEKTFMDTV